MAKKKKAKKKTLKKRQESSAPAHVLDQLYVLIDSHKSADRDTSTASAWCWSRTQAASLVTCSRDLERAPTCAERMGHGPYETATEGLTLLAEPPPTQWLQPSICARSILLLPRFPTMPRKTESLALHLIRGLYDAAERRPMQWRSLDDLDVPQTVEAVRYATNRGWILVESGNSVCLTDAGWRLTELL